MAYIRNFYVSQPRMLGIDLTTIGWPASYNPQFLQRLTPQIVPQGFTASGSGGGSGYIKAITDDDSISGSLTKIIGRHTLKFGGEFRRLPSNYGQPGGGADIFNFTNAFTAANPLSSTLSNSTGSGYASYLLGLGSNANSNVTNVNIMAAEQKYAGAYIGDTFQLSHKLTLNLGVRWEYPGYWTERYDREAVFLPGAVNPVLQQAGLPAAGDVVLVNSSRYSDRHNQIPHWKLFAPRIGAAYRLNDKTVVRSGFGMFYSPGDTVQNASPYVAPINSAATPWIASLDGGFTPATLLNNPFPNGLLTPAGRNSSYESTLPGTTVVVPIPNDRSPYAMNWNFDIERQLGGGSLFEIAYVGERGVHLRDGGGLVVNGMGFNQIPTQNLALGSQLLNQVANPFYGTVKSGTLAAPTVPAGQLLLPYPQYTGVFSPTTAAFDNIYNSLQLKLEKRFQAGGTLLVAYTWAKDVGNADTMTGFLEAYQPGSVQNYYNISADRSLLSYDVPHRLSISYVVDLPFGKGKHFLSGVSGLTGKLVSGWGVNGITTLQSGFPIILTAQPTAVSQYFGGGSPRPNVTAGCDKSMPGSAQSRVSAWFNTGCYSQPSAFGFGDESRTDPNLRTAGIANWDFAVFKETPIKEQVSLQFRTEFFNIFNRVQFGPPGNQLGSSLFGLISSQLNNPRLVQCAMRLSF